MIISCCIVHSGKPFIFDGVQLIFHELATDSRAGAIKIRKRVMVGDDKLFLLDTIFIRRPHRDAIISLNQLGVEGFETMS